MEIEPRHLSLGKLLTGRLFRIPDYQRSYSWRKKQRNDMFCDIKAIASDLNRTHFMSTVVGLRRETVRILTDEHHRIDIVDGQQRLTTLIILLRSIANILSTKRQNEKIVRQDLEKILIKKDKVSLLLLQTNHDTGNYFANYLRYGSHESAGIAKTAADKELLLAIEECEKFVADWVKEKGDLIELVSLLKNRLTFIFHEIDEEKLVYTVFEVLNSRGLDVSWFDRLKSMLMAVVFESDGGNVSEHIKEVHKIWSQIYECAGLDLELSTEALRFAATLWLEEQPKRLLSEADAVECLREKSSRGAAEVISTSRWLLRVTQAVARLYADHQRKAVTEFSQARLLAVAVNLREDLTADEREALLQRWENVTFRIYGIHRKDSRTKVGDYVRLAWAVTRGELDPEGVLAQLKWIGRDFPLARGLDEFVKNEDCYSGWGEEIRYMLYRRERYLAEHQDRTLNEKKWKAIWEGQAAESIEHVLPQKNREQKLVHRLGNLVLLPPRVNSRLGATEPKKKKEEYLKTGLLVAQEVADSLPAWDARAIRQREKELLAWAKKEWAD